jgi:hypothetical protein
MQVLLAVALALGVAGVTGASSAWTGALSGASGLDPGVGSVPQGTQTDTTYAQSFQSFGVMNVDATTQQVSCYRPEVDASAFNDGPERRLQRRVRLSGRDHG